MRTFFGTSTKLPPNAMPAPTSPGLSPAALVAALGAAAAFAVASVLQQRAAAREPATHGLRWGLLVTLHRRPQWLAGKAADYVALALQAVALSHGSLVVVQLLLSCGLIVALGIESLLTGRRLGRRDWLAALALVGALVAFFALGHPTRGGEDAPLARWGLAFALIAVAVAVAVRGGRKAGPAWKGASLSVAAGLCYGLSGALLKAETGAFHDGGVVGALVNWRLVAFLLVAAVGTLLVQSAFQSAPLASSLPALTVVEPVVALPLGALLFSEHLRLSGIGVPGLVLALGAMVVALVALARSPLSVRR